MLLCDEPGRAFVNNQKIMPIRSTRYGDIQDIVAVTLLAEAALAEVAK
jgi:hypothetical protein